MIDKKKNFSVVLNRKSNIIALFICLMVVVSNILSSLTKWYYNSAIVFDVLFMVVAIVVLAFTGKFTIDVREIRYFVFFTGYLMMTLTFTNGTFGSVMSLVWGILWIIVLENGRYGADVIRIMRWAFGILFIFLLAQTNGYYDRWIKGLADDIILNPNTMAFLIGLFSAIFLIIMQDVYYYRIFHMAFFQIIATVVGIVNAGSRGALLMFLSFVALKYFMHGRWKRNKKLIQAIYASIVMAGVCFPLVYILLYEEGFTTKVSFLAHKDFFTGREWIWGMITDALSSTKWGWLFGAGSHSVLSLDGVMINTHSSYMSVLMRFGLVGVATYFGFFEHILGKIYDRQDLTDKQIDFVFLCFAYAVLSMFEMTALGHAFLLTNTFLWTLPLSLNYRKKRNYA